MEEKEFNEELENEFLDEEIQENILQDEIEAKDELEQIQDEIEQVQEPLNENFNEEFNEGFIEEAQEEIKPLEEEIEPTYQEQTQKQDELISVRPVKFQQFEPTPPNRSIKKNLDIMQDISMHVSVELGRTKSSIREIMDLEKGSIVELDKIAGEQVEIFVNDKFVAKGEVIVIEDKFGVRVTSTAISNK